MKQEDWKLFVWILITITLLVTAFAFWYFYWAITYTPPEEIVINLTELNYSLRPK